MSGQLRRVIVYGGKGGLGSQIVNHFKANGWWVCCVDLSANDDANASVVVDPSLDWITQEETVCSAVTKNLEDNKVDAILNVAGGWAGGSSKSKDFIKNSDLMWRQSVWSSAISARLASKCLNNEGCLVLPGAAAATEGTPGMIGYGMAKAAVHQLVKSLAADKSGLPEGAFVAAILPVTLDTPMNRKWMPKADTSTWTPLEYVAKMLYNWATDVTSRPSKGSLVKLITKAGETETVMEN